MALLFAKVKVASVAVVLAVDYTLRAALCASLVMVDCRVQRLGFLQAFAADRGFQWVT